MEKMSGFRAHSLLAAEAYFFHSLNLLCARILALATHRAGVDPPTEQSRRDGTACSPARECRVAYGLEASPGGRHSPADAVPFQDRQARHQRSLGPQKKGCCRKMRRSRKNQSMVTLPLPTSYIAARIASFSCFTRSPSTGEVSRSTDACSTAFCRLAVVKSPLAPAIAGWMY
jgi:hypothetical protein